MDRPNYTERYAELQLSREALLLSHCAILDMIISVKETTVFSVFHPDAQDLYNTCSDLKRMAMTLWNPSLRLNAEVNPPISSQLLSAEILMKK